MLHTEITIAMFIRVVTFSIYLGGYNVTLPVAQGVLCHECHTMWLAKTMEGEVVSADGCGSSRLLRSAAEPCWL